MRHFHILVAALVLVIGQLARTSYLRQPNANIVPNDQTVLENVQELLTEYELQARGYLAQINTILQKTKTTSSLLEWNLMTNITDENARAVENHTVKHGDVLVKMKQIVAGLDLSLLSPESARQIHLLLRGAKYKGIAKVRRVTEIRNEMEAIYNGGKMCFPNGKCYSGEPDLAQFMMTSKDPEALLTVWKGWRDTVGPKIRKLYPEFINLQNGAAKNAGFQDAGELWRDELEIEDFENVVEQLWMDILPLYQQLHAYVRRKLIKFYGADKINATGPIPAHLLGNMWGQKWEGIVDITRPYPDYPTVDISKELKKQNYTAKGMFKTAEDFFVSIGLDPMTPLFWKNSMIEEPKDKRKVACHGSSFNFFDGKDYRIKMCTKLTMDDFYTVHHEMGHVEYYMQYKDLPIIFQEGANSAFHEAIGDTVAFSVMTPDHLYEIGLLKDLPDTPEEYLNFLMSQALQKLAFLPFGLIVDKWRWNVFQGKITPENYNQKWWELRRRYQGIKSPIPRSEDDFDPGAKYHIPSNTPYIRYYISHIMQFQFHKALCEAKYRKRNRPPLHRCDIYRSGFAGWKLKQMMSLGTSKPWQDAMETLTGQRHIDTHALKEYFEPLIPWLQKANEGEIVGWNEDD